MIQKSDIQKLRAATSAGMLDCKRALELSNGDYEAAYRHIRTQGQAKAETKSSRVTSNGVVLTHNSEHGAAMIEINCETDFVAKNEMFQSFSKELLKIVFDNKVLNEVDLLKLPMYEATVEEARLDLISRMGENIKVRRCCYLAAEDKSCTSYQHGQRIGVILKFHGDADLAASLAMQIAAFRDIVLTPEDIPAEILARERAIAVTRVSSMGKSEAISLSIIEGMIAKFIDSNTLSGQEFMVDTSHKVSEILKLKNTSIQEFIRFELGLGQE